MRFWSAVGFFAARAPDTNGRLPIHSRGSDLAENAAPEPMETGTDSDPLRVSAPSSPRSLGHPKCRRFRSKLDYRMNAATSNRACSGSVCQACRCTDPTPLNGGQRLPHASAALRRARYESSSSHHFTQSPALRSLRPSPFNLLAVSNCRLSLPTERCRLSWQLPKRRSNPGEALSKTTPAARTAFQARSHAPCARLQRCKSSDSPPRLDEAHCSPSTLSPSTLMLQQQHDSDATDAPMTRL